MIKKKPFRPIGFITKIVSRLLIKVKLELQRPETIIFLISGLVVLEWLHGDLLFFWDEVFPFHSGSDIYYYSFTWGQLYGSFGNPIQPNEYLIYFFLIFLMHNIFFLSYTLSQTLLIYSLFVLSGLGMSKLILFLSNYQMTNKFFLVPLSGGLLYMFNFFVSGFLFADFNVVWFTYALLPFAILIFLKGLKLALRDEKYHKYVLYFAVLVQLMSIGFSLTPYFILFIILLFVVLLNTIRNELDITHRINKKRVLHYLIYIIILVFVTGLWWEYAFIQSVFLDITTLSSAGIYSFQANYMISEFTTGGLSQIKRFFYVFASYPIPNAAIGANIFSWQSVYINSSSVFIILASVFIFLIFFPLFFGKSKGKVIIRNSILYPTIILISFIDLKGLNPLNSVLVHFATYYHIPFLGFLYATKQEFLGFILIFLDSIAFSKTIYILCSNEFKIATKIDTPHFESLRKKKIRLLHRLNVKKIIALIVIVIIIGIYPWYMWTPLEAQVYHPNHNSVVPSTVDFPNYFYSLNNYLNTHSNGSDTLILPETYVFYGMNFTNSSFVDDSPAGLISGSPVVYHLDPSNNVYQYIENIIYDNLTSGKQQFTNLLSAFNIKYILLNTIFIDANAYPYYNITYLIHFLEMQQGIVQVARFGPLILYLNTRYQGIIQVGEPIYDNTTISYPNGSISLLHSKGLPNNMIYKNASFISGEPKITVLNITSSKISLFYPRFNASINPVVINLNSSPIPINITQYPYLSITFNSSPYGLASIYSYDYFAYIINGVRINASTQLIAVNPSGQLLNLGSAQNPYYSSRLVEPLVFHLSCKSLFPNITSNVSDLVMERFSLGLLFLGNTNQSSNFNVYSIVFSKTMPTFNTDMILLNVTGTKNLILSSSNKMIHSSSMVVPSYSFREMNPTRYIVKIKNSTTPYAIFLKQDYSNEWNISINGNPCLNAIHFKADGFGNGWYINKNGNYTVTIIYTPQQIYDKLVVVSITANLSEIFVVATLIIKKRRSVKW